MPQNMIEKIAGKFAVGLSSGSKVHCGDYISFSPAFVMTHDNTGAVIPKFKETGADALFNPEMVVITLDHNIQDKSEKNLQKYEKIKSFAHSKGAHFFPAGRGIGHQIMVEEGFAFPGTMVVASDSHSNMYGGLGVLGTPVVRTDAASIWATGRTWWQVPPVSKVILKGKLRKGVTGKDVIITLCSFYNKDEVLNNIIEFAGEGVSSLSIDDRLTIANMTTEWGALGGVFPVDSVTLSWLKNRSDVLNKTSIHPRVNPEKIAELETRLDEINPDFNAFYSQEITLDLSSVEPSVSGPNTVKKSTPVSQIKNKDIYVQKAYLVSCVNSRSSDISEAAAVMKNRTVAPGVSFYIAAASDEVQKESEIRGDWQILIDAGAIPLPPGCGPCIGLGAGLLEPGETGISATNRNFKGRMGSSDALAYLASPAVVAYSAASGKIDFDIDYNGSKQVYLLKENVKPIREKYEITIIPGFPESITGRLIFCYQDNMNTDGIYPGKYTYTDDFTPEQQAEVVMENYDPEFGKLAGKGDILAGGFNFGTGSSREQAATALKYKGISLVIAGSFSDTYNRNALNNGFLTIRCPELINDLKSFLGTEKLTYLSDKNITVNFKESTIVHGDMIYEIDPVGKAAQELIVDGGLENWIKRQISNK